MIISAFTLAFFRGIDAPVWFSIFFSILLTTGIGWIKELMDAKKYENSSVNGFSFKDIFWTVLGGITPCLVLGFEILVELIKIEMTAL